MAGRDRIAIDIETIPNVSDPDFDCPEHWIPFCIALGFSDGGKDETEVEVIFRDSHSLNSERESLNSTIDWIADQSSRDPLLITYNGGSCDLPILKHRAYVIDGEIPDSNLVDRLNLLLQSSTHVDLIDYMRRQEGYWVSLDDALDKHEIDSDEPEWLGKPVDGSDMPSFGLELLTDRPNDDLREVTRRYAAADVRPLFRLDDKLRDINPTLDTADRSSDGHG